MTLSTRQRQRSMGRNPRDPAGDPEGTVYHPDDLLEDANIIVWCKDIAATLEKHYPGWRWGIKPDPRNKIISIVNLDIDSDDLWGFNINLRKTPIEDGRVRRDLTIRAGGEILERFGIRRGPYNRVALANCRRLAGKPTPFLGDKRDRPRRSDIRDKV